MTHLNHLRTRHQLLTFRLWSLLVSIVLLLVCPKHSQAIPLTEYHKNLQQAITAIDTLTQADEEESLAHYQNRVTETIVAIRNAIPENQPVLVADEICNVDNSWLHRELGEFEKSPDSKRPEIAAHILQRLEAIEERVTEMQRPGDAISKSEANRRLAGILSRSEYAPKSKEGSAIARLAKDFWRWLMSLLPKRKPLQPGQADLLSKLAEIFVVLVALAVIAWVITMFAPRLLKSRKQKVRSKPQPRIVLGERLEPEESAGDLLSEAEILARRGELRAAIRKAYIALLVELGDRKIISLAQHKTNRDYLRAVSSVPELYTNMSGLTDSFERHWYGIAQATQHDWQDFQAAYKATLRQ